MMPRPQPPDQPKGASFIDKLQSEGRYSFSLEEFSRVVGPSKASRQAALVRLKAKGRLVSPRREFYVIVPPEYRIAGAPPPSWYIDDLMRFLDQPYYVGLLSAAAIHGAAHQSPQVFQVVTSLPTLPMAAGRARLEFFRKRTIEGVATARVKTETGYMTVSTPEATVFDLIRHFHAVGHLSNVATVLAELAETIDPKKLSAAAAQASQAEVQRTGYLFQTVGQEALAVCLEQLLQPHRRRVAPLRPDAPSEGMPLDPRWNLIINEEVEPDQ
jgi:predicted transcriptional regulator of viral defense system